MGGQGLSKGLIIGIIIGLIAGFSGGYFYKNLNASAPVSTTSTETSSNKILSLTSEDGDQSGVIGDVVMTGVYDGLIDYLKEQGSGNIKDGVNSLYQTNSVSQIPVKHSAVERLLGLVSDKASAQKNCSVVELDWAASKIKTSLNNYFSGLNDPCLESVLISADALFSIYWDTNGIYIKVTLRGNQVTTKWEKQADGSCAKSVITKPYSKSFVINEYGNLIGGVPTGATLVCSGGSNIRETFINPKFDKTKCCGPDKAVITPTTTE